MLKELRGEPEAAARRRISRLKKEKLIAEASPGSWVPVCPNCHLDRRRLQHFLGHASITNTVRYTAMSPDPFKDFWR
jgi:hypothetical protein